jgi:HEPN domain-containing protein
MSEQTDLIKAWFEKADHDLGSAKVIFLNVPGYYDTIAFHCQQSAEKYLKAAFVFFEIQPPKSHDLVYLLEVLSTKINFEEHFYKQAIILNGFGVVIRYPDQTINLTKEETENAIHLSETFRSFVINIINKP